MAVEAAKYNGNSKMTSPKPNFDNQFVQSELAVESRETDIVFCVSLFTYPCYQIHSLKKR